MTEDAPMPAGFAALTGSAPLVQTTPSVETGVERAERSGGTSKAQGDSLKPFCADDARVACPLFQAEYGGSTPTSALQLQVAKMPARMAMALNRKWHSRLPEIGNGMQCVAYGATCSNVWYAVALWSAPVARLLNGKGLLELRRMAIADDAPKNTGSRMLRIMAMLIKRERPDVLALMSYQDTDVHTGTIYKAAGWTPRVMNDSQSKWAMPNRPRSNGPASQSVKVRWELVLRVGGGGAERLGENAPATEKEQNGALCDGGTQSAELKP